MERKEAFEEGEVFHLYTRGVEKRIVFHTTSDYDRFLLLLFVCNGTKRVEMRNLLHSYQGLPLVDVFDRIKREETIVDILAYSLMPSHFHLIVREKQKGGISKFMLKLMTAYSMYFNTKHARSGPLFTRPFRSRHINSDEYFRWVFAYVLLNPLELHQPDWKEKGLRSSVDAAHYMQSYPYGSYREYFTTNHAISPILQKSALPVDVQDIKTMDDLLVALSENEVFASPSFV